MATSKSRPRRSKRPVAPPTAICRQPDDEPCPATTLAGKPCPQKVQVATIRGKRYQLKTCFMHAPKAIKEELGIRPGAKKGAGRKMQPTAHSILRERFEEEADRYLQPFEEALVAMKAVVVGNGASAHIEEVEDVALRLRAIESILDRIYGRPKQVTELSGIDGDAIEVEVPNDDERARQLAQVLVSTGALPTIIPPNASASAPSTN